MGFLSIRKADAVTSWASPLWIKGRAHRKHYVDLMCAVTPWACYKPALAVPCHCYARLGSCRATEKPFKHNPHVTFGRDPYSSQATIWLPQHNTKAQMNDIKGQHTWPICSEASPLLKMLLKYRSSWLMVAVAYVLLWRVLFNCANPFRITEKDVSWCSISKCIGNHQSACDMMQLSGRTPLSERCRTYACAFNLCIG